MYKFGSAFALLMVLLLSYPISTQAAATRYGLKMQFTASDGTDAGMALLEFDPIPFNTWVAFDELNNVSSSGVWYTKTVVNPLHKVVINFNQPLTIFGGQYYQVMISDAQPWYPVMTNAVDPSYIMQWRFGDDLGMWANEFDYDRLYWDWEMQSGEAGVAQEIVREDVDVAFSVWFDDPVPAPVPIPASAILLVSGLLPVAVFRKRFVRT